MSTTAIVPFRFFVQTPVFSVSTSSFSLLRYSVINITSIKTGMDRAAGGTTSSISTIFPSNFPRRAVTGGAGREDGQVRAKRGWEGDVEGVEGDSHRLLTPRSVCNYM